MAEQLKNINFMLKIIIPLTLLLVIFIFINKRLTIEIENTTQTSHPVDQSQPLKSEKSYLRLPDKNVSSDNIKEKDKEDKVRKSVDTKEKPKKKIIIYEEPLKDVILVQ